MAFTDTVSDFFKGLSDTATSVLDTAIAIDSKVDQFENNRDDNNVAITTAPVNDGIGTNEFKKETYAKYAAIGAGLIVVALLLKD